MFTRTFAEMVIRIGLEPMTYCLEGSCSIQLSYRTISLNSAAKIVLFLEKSRQITEGGKKKFSIDLI